jgi:integrase/recombinase XerD
MAIQGKAAFIDPNQFNELISVVKSKSRNKLRDVCILELGYRTGMRSASLASLRLDQVVNLKGEVLKRCVLESSQVKGGSNYFVFLTHPRLIAALEEYLEVRPDSKGNNLFLTERGNGYSAHGMSELIGNLMKKAELTGASGHSLRRSFCSNKLNAGADLPSLKVLMNHKSLSTTIIYCETDERRLEALVSGSD